MAGAFRAVGLDDFADTIINSTKAILHGIYENNPFPQSETMLPTHSFSPRPIVIRIINAWTKMREQIINSFSDIPITQNKRKLVTNMNNNYVNDAYNSLSIEGYRVTERLIQQVREGKWDPQSQKDSETVGALASRGYFEASKAVEKSVEAMLREERPPGVIVKKDLLTWLYCLFAPNARAGIIEKKYLAGYRHCPVYINKSRHVPPSNEHLLDAMDAFFELLINEKQACVRAILGHFMFVFIHPFIDGNGRLGRFIMNSMFISGGYPWVIIPVTERNVYMQTLEMASIGKDIRPFTTFLKSHMQKAISDLKTQ